ncbi:molybdate ABC transporter substrate-binding protein [Paenibacillus aurantiacus]|uniref:Molybdate ABC transporter substrate-binding protein n=1 Tax=Paenibacillus aurantiacus TaxID=1936118 RepID=A0ABV5KTJ4_9BACL
MPTQARGRRMTILLLILCLLFAAAAVVYLVRSTGTSPTSQADARTELVISAAASLKDGLEALKPRFEEAYPSIRLTFNYGSSGALQKQIEQGAPADLFLSAGTQQIEALRKRALIKESVTLLGNELVVVVPKDDATVKTLDGLGNLADERYRVIAVGQPETVPAGQYAKEALEATGIWGTIADRLVFAKDVRQALAYAETGNADAALVYATDAAASSQAVIALRIDSGLHAPIVYPAALLAESDHPNEAAIFYKYLKSAEAAESFASFGFLPAAGAR